MADKKRSLYASRDAVSKVPLDPAARGGFDINQVRGTLFDAPDAEWQAKIGDYLGGIRKQAVADQQAKQQQNPIVQQMMQPQQEPSAANILMGNARSATGLANAAMQENTPNKPAAYLDAARARQLASNAGGSYGDLPPLGVWSGPMQSRFKPTSVRTSDQLSPKEQAHDARLAANKQNWIQQQQSRHRVEHGSSTPLLEALRSASPEEANRILMASSPDAWAHVEAARLRGPDLQGQAAMMTAQAQADLMKNNPGLMGVPPEHLAQQAFSKGELPPQYYPQMKAIAEGLGGIGKPGIMPWQMSHTEHKAKVLAELGKMHGKIPAKTLSDWYDATYGAPHAVAPRWQHPANNTPNFRPAGPG